MPAAQDLRGKIVLITGASTGIGRATADRVAAAGATVIGTSRYAWRYPQPPNWSLFQMDQTSDDSVKQLIDRCAACAPERQFSRATQLRNPEKKECVAEPQTCCILLTTLYKTAWGTVCLWTGAVSLG